jgi:hypothetical protein
MKTRTTIALLAVLSVTILTASALAVTQLGCQAQAMSSSDEVPASEGTIKVTEDINGNAKLMIRVKHMATPSKVRSDATVFVVWIQPPNAPKQNVGALIVDENLEGRLETVTPFRRFQVTVTPESSAQIEQPTHEPVLTFNAELPD